MNNLQQLYDMIRSSDENDMKLACNIIQNNKLFQNMDEEWKGTNKYYKNKIHIGEIILVIYLSINAKTKYEGHAHALKILLGDKYRSIVDDLYRLSTYTFTFILHPSHEGAWRDWVDKYENIDDYINISNYDSPGLKLDIIRMDLNDEWDLNSEMINKVSYNKVPLIICNFAIHYLAYNKTRMSNFTNLINAHMSENGDFIFTVLDDIKIINFGTGAINVPVSFFVTILFC
jgi:hypothetical protein